MSEPVGANQHMLLFLDDLEERTLDRLTSRDASRARVVSFVKAAVALFQCLETDLVAVFFAIDFELATGRERNRWGEIVGEPRGGLSDDRYKAWQLHRVYVNSNNATIPRALALLKAIFDTTRVSVRPMFPNGAYFEVSTDFLSDDLEIAHLRPLMRDYQPAGAAWAVVEVPAGVFQFTTVFNQSAGLRMARMTFAGR